MHRNLHQWVLENQQVLNQLRLQRATRAAVADQMKELYLNPQERNEVAEWTGGLQQVMRDLALNYADGSEVHDIAQKLLAVAGRLDHVLYNEALPVGRGATLTKLSVTKVLADQGATDERVGREVDAYLRELHQSDGEVGALAGRLRAMDLPAKPRSLPVPPAPDSPEPVPMRAQPAPADQPAKDFFISYSGADRSWAEWIAWQLEAAGYTAVIQAWDFRPAPILCWRCSRGLPEPNARSLSCHPTFSKRGLPSPSGLRRLPRTRPAKKAPWSPCVLRTATSQACWAQSFVSISSARTKARLDSFAGRGAARPWKALAGAGLPRCTGVLTRAGAETGLPAGVACYLERPASAQPELHRPHAAARGPARCAPLGSARGADPGHCRARRGGQDPIGHRVCLSPRSGVRPGVVGAVGRSRSSCCRLCKFRAKPLGLPQQAESDQQVVAQAVREWLRQHPGGFSSLITPMSPLTSMTICQRALLDIS